MVSNPLKRLPKCKCAATGTKGIVNHSPPTLRPLIRWDCPCAGCVFLLVLLLVPLAACALNGRPATYLIETKGPYTLDTGDVVRVTVYGDPELPRATGSTTAARSCSRWSGR